MRSGACRGLAVAVVRFGRRRAPWGHRCTDSEGRDWSRAGGGSRGVVHRGPSGRPPPPSLRAADRGGLVGRATEGWFGPWTPGTGGEAAGRRARSTPDRGLPGCGAAPRWAALPRSCRTGRHDRRGATLGVEGSRKRAHFRQSVPSRERGRGDGRRGLLRCAIGLPRLVGRREENGTLGEDSSVVGAEEGGGDRVARPSARTRFVPGPRAGRGFA